MLSCSWLPHLLLKNSGMMVSGQTKDPFGLALYLKQWRVIGWQGCRTTGAESSSGWKGPQEASGPISCSQQGQLWGQMGLLRASSRWGLKNSKDEKCKTCASTWMSFCWETFCLYWGWTSPVSVNAHCPLSSHSAWLWWAQLHILDDLHIGTGACF